MLTRSLVVILSSTLCRSFKSGEPKQGELRQGKLEQGEPK